MMPEKNVVDERTRDCWGFKKPISWTAVFAGAIVGLGLSFLLYVFGAAIGLTSFPTTQAGTNALAIGGFLGSVIGAVVSMFVGGWISGYLARKRYGYKEYSITEDHDSKSCGNIGALYGFLTWALALIVTILLAADVSSFIAARYVMSSNPRAAIFTTTNPQAPIVSENRTRNDSNAPTNTTINEEKAAEAAGKTLFALFAIFFLGALSSCIGGYMGIRFRCKHDVEGKRSDTNTSTSRF